LSGLIIVDDDEDRALNAALGTAFGVTDIPIMLQDPRYGEDGELLYSTGAHGGVHGHLRHIALANLTPRAHLDVATTLYRFRLLNASNARIYRIAFLHEAAPLPFDVVGGDGGLLREPERVRELYLAPSERADVVLDLRGAAPCERIVAVTLPVELLSAADAPAYEGRVPRTCEPLELFLLRVVRRAAASGSIPATLSDDAPAVNGRWPLRAFTLDFRDGLWRINGATYRVDRTAFPVSRHQPEIWEFRSVGAAMPHPIHVHGYQFRLLERRHASAQSVSASGRSDGIAATERGWKDTVLLWPGETLRIAIDFAHPHAGDQVYMVQCHNLEHGSHGMMVNFRVAA